MAKKETPAKRLKSALKSARNGKGAEKKVRPKPKKKTADGVSPLAPKTLADLPEIGGVALASGHTATKYKKRDDLMVAVMAPGTAAAGVFTTSKTASASVEWCRSNLSDQGEGRVLVVNAGNANAFTGKAGVASVKATAAAAASAVGCRQKDVFVASTGVIGEVLDPDPVVKTMLPAFERATNGQAGGDQWERVARAIMTTDTYPKLATRTAMIGDTKVTLNGIAKGSGMIAPDLATMLSFIFTDAAISQNALQTLLSLGVRDSFNSITVDSDTSTSDMVLAFATGAAGGTAVQRAGDPRLRDFRAQLHDLMLDLAHQVVRDGEGASKFVEINVSGGASYAAARRIALAVANSPLVKTAIAGSDANWGRIVMAVGKAGEEANRDKLAISIGGIEVAKQGVAVADYDEAPVARHMKGRKIDIDIDVGVGKARATVWTCDFTYDYIRINADYRS